MTTPDEIKDVLDRARELARLSGHDFASSAKIEVHAGGAAMWGIAWFCSFCAAFMAGAMLIGGFWVSSEFARNSQERAELRSQDSDFKDYISAIYQVAPELQKKLNEAKKAQEDQ